MRRLIFTLELLLVRGAGSRLAFIALLIVAVSVSGGLAAWLVAPADFEGLPDAAWWAFLRLSDPGYLGDDRGLAKRFVSTVLTVGGYVIFLGALVAIMTQWLNATLARLERGESPVALSGHLLVVGWSERSASVVEEFLRSQTRVRGFLRRGENAERVRVVLLIDWLDPDVHAEVRDRLADVWDSRILLIRAGSRLKLEHLERVAFADAAAIVLPGNHESESDLPNSEDVATIKTLMSIARHPRVRESGHPPRIVAELTDNRMSPLADFAYPGQLDVIPSDLHVARLIVQNVLNPGLSALYGDLLSFRTGAALFVTNLPELAGLTLHEAGARFSRAVPIGVVRDGVAHMSVPENPRMLATDQLVLIATAHGEIEPDQPGRAVECAACAVLPAEKRNLTVLCVGWSERIPAVLREFGAHTGVDVEVELVAVTPAATRATALAAHGPLPEGVSLRHLEADYTVPEVVRALRPERFDAIVVLGSARTKTNEEMDARSLVAYLALREVLGEDAGPPVLVELGDPRNATLFTGRRGEVIVSPRVVSSLLAHVTLRRELLPVYDTLFRAGGPSFRFRPRAAYGIPDGATFAEIREATARVGHIAIGVRDTRLHLVPPPSARLHAPEIAVLAPCHT